MIVGAKSAIALESVTARHVSEECKEKGKEEKSETTARRGKDFESAAMSLTGTHAESIGGFAEVSPMNRGRIVAKGENVFIRFIFKSSWNYRLRIDPLEVHHSLQL